MPRVLFTYLCVVCWFMRRLIKIPIKREFTAKAEARKLVSPEREKMRLSEEVDIFHQKFTNGHQELRRSRNLCVKNFAKLTAAVITAKDFFNLSAICNQRRDTIHKFCLLIFSKQFAICDLRFAIHNIVRCSVTLANFAFIK